MGYVVSRKGTFGVIDRRYVNLEGKQMVVIRWGPLDWLTPVALSDIHECKGSYEGPAREEARAWVEAQEDD
jgi:hypothetical protein